MNITIGGKIQSSLILFHKGLHRSYHIPMKLYIADCHFHHANLLTSMDQRPFSSVEEMNDSMIERWNAKVRGADEVYILGDLSLANVEETEKILRRLKGKLHLITGNHDSFVRKERFDKSRFRSIGPYLETNDEGRKVILCHYPILFYNGQFKGDKCYMLYGHVHNTFDEVLINRFINTGRSEPRPFTGGEMGATPFNLINCFCMFSGYQPLSLDEWIEVDRKRRKAMQQ